MKLSAADSFPYSLPLTRPMPGSPGALTREGMLIRLRSESGAEGWGDVAPLPGFSLETLAAAEAQLTSVRGRLLAAMPSFSAQPSWIAALLRPLAALELFPSVRFGLECALCNLASAEWRAPWRQRLERPALPEVRLNALLSGTGDEAVREARGAAAQGFRTLKVKVGRQSVQKDIDTVRRVSGVLAGEASLRLDANRAWTLQEALEFARGIEACPVEYLEEPLRDPHAMGEFVRGSVIPAAVDESLEALGGAGTLMAGLRAVVIKPTLRGGFSGALRWADVARRAGAVPVISSSFESAVGLRALLELASLIHDAGVAAGLDTGRWIARDVAECAVPARHGVVNITSLPALRVELTGGGK